jgi:hypothetical protein
MNDFKSTHHLYFTHLPTLFHHLDVYAWDIVVMTYITTLEWNQQCLLMVLFFRTESLVFILRFIVTSTFNKCVLHDEFTQN